MRQDIASLKQTKNYKRINDAYPLVGTGGGGKTKKQNYYKQNCNLRQGNSFHSENKFCSMSQGWKS